VCMRNRLIWEVLKVAMMAFDSWWDNFRTAFSFGSCNTYVSCSRAGCTYEWPPSTHTTGCITLVVLGRVILFLSASPTFSLAVACHFKFGLTYKRRGHHDHDDQQMSSRALPKWFLKSHVGILYRWSLPICSKHSIAVPLIIGLRITETVGSW